MHLLLAALSAFGWAASAKTGVVIPMYVYPGALWNQVIAAKLQHPSVPIVLIANVNNGPGGSRDPVYASYIARAQKAGVSVIGYTYSQYGNRNPAVVEQAMNAWVSFYRVNGIFIDEMNPNDGAYYRTLTAYAHAHALPFVMGNPGTNAPGNAGPDVINFYEQGGYPTLQFLGSAAHRAYGKGRWSYMAGAVPYNASFIAASTQYVAYIYATDSHEPECYCNLPTYFTQLVALLDTASF